MSRKRKANKTGRGSNALSDFVALERYILRSPAWRALRPVARAAYVEISANFDGANNGRIQMAARTLGERLGVNKATASRAIKELEAHGFIETARYSSFTLKLKCAAEYRLAAFRCDVTGALPSKSFMRWQPEIQNTVAPAQPLSCTSATDGQKTTQNSPFQLHQRNREAPKQVVHGCTSAPLLESTMGGDSIGHAVGSDGAASQKASAHRDRSQTSDPCDGPMQAAAFLPAFLRP